MNKQRCILLFFILVMFLFINKLNLNYIEHIGDKFYVKNSEASVIYDALHETTPYISKFEYISDLICILLLLALLFVNKKLFYNFIGFIITIFIIRSITMAVTILPKNKKCNTIHSSMFRGGCYDKIFSGHFSMGLLSSIMLYEYNYINLFLLLIINFMNAIFIILSRAHYTIDILIALLVTLFVYTNNLNICIFLDKYI